MTFLCNTEATATQAEWHNKNFHLSGTSVVILDDDASVLFNTSAVNSTGLPTKRTFKGIYGASDLAWSSWTETYPLFSNAQQRPDAPTLNTSPLEQIRFSNDSSEYLVYATNFTLDSAQSNVKVFLHLKFHKDFL